MLTEALIVVGPTGVGKSRWAMDYAKQHGGTIINADSQQCYKACPVLTARPSIDDEKAYPHVGYGVLASHEKTTVAWWLNNIAVSISEVEKPIVVGGTGMYIDALLNGLSTIPPIDQHIVDRVDDFSLTPGWMHQVKRLDPALPVTMVDGQRLKRALSVLWQTGRSITSFWSERTYTIANLKAHVVVVDSDMLTLSLRLENRFKNMLKAGALEEVRFFCDQPESVYQGIKHAIGFSTFMSFLNGDISQDCAEQQMLYDTRRYAKRQRTWFRNRMALGPLVEKITQVVVS